MRNTVKVPVIGCLYQAMGTEECAYRSEDHTGNIFQNIQDNLSWLIMKDYRSHFLIDFFGFFITSLFPEERCHLVHNIIVVLVEFLGILFTYQSFDLI